MKALQHFWFGSIRRQLTLSFALVTSLVMFTFSYQIVQDEREFLLKQNLLHLSELGQSIAVSSTSWLLADDVVGLQEVLHGITGIPHIKYAMVLSPEGRVMAANDAATIGLYLHDEISQKIIQSNSTKPQVLLDNRNMVDIAVPVIAQSELIGWIRIASGRNELNENLASVVQDSLILGLSAIAISILIALLLSKGLTAKLDRILQVANQVHAGQFNMRIDKIDVGEIGDLASNINRMLDALHSANQRNELLLASMADGIYGVDMDGITTFINPAGAKMLGYSMDELVGKKQHSLTHHTHRDGTHYPAKDCKVYAAFRQGTSYHVTDELFWRKDNTSFPVEYVSAPIIEDGKITGAVVSFSDITQQKRNEELIWRQANFDALTDLPNRRLFQEHLDHEIKRAKRSTTLFALFFIDLDHFKEINDTLGHDMEDVLLQEAAQRLSECVRETDVVARMGGDEFTVILTDLDSPDNIEHIAQSILNKLAKPFILGNESSYLSASLGITIYPEDATTPTALLKNADQAMYEAKSQGRNQVQYFTPVMQESIQNRMSLIHDLREALSNQQFRVFYQPIVDIQTGKIHKAEALVRWQHPTQGLISPDAFIPIAEDTGLIIDIGDWVFKQAAEQVKKWRTSYNAEFQISVNKSPVQFHNELGTSHNDWFEYLETRNLPGQSIVMEITESILMSSKDLVASQLLLLREGGIQIALDDFGTGYSSLAYLKKFDIDYIKIDQSFVRNLALGSEDLALCEAIIVMAHKLDMQVIAEGVETKTQFDLLAEAGCDYAQGYLFSKPVPADEFEKLLQV